MALDRSIRQGVSGIKASEHSSVAMTKPVILGERKSGGRRLFSKHLGRKVTMLYNDGFRVTVFAAPKLNGIDEPVGRSVTGFSSGKSFGDYEYERISREVTDLLRYFDRILGCCARKTRRTRWT